MALLNYSQDILYLVLAFCVLWLTVFLIWFIYYLIVTIKQFYQMTSKVKRSVDQVEETINLLKEKIEHSASYLSIIVDGVKKMVSVFASDSPEREVVKDKIKQAKDKTL